RLVLLILFILSLSASSLLAADSPPQSSAPDPKLEALRRKVTEAEALYRNFDVRYTVKVEYGTPEQREQLEQGLEVSPPLSQLDLLTEIHAIRQQDYLRIEEESRPLNETDNSWFFQSLMVFNGHETRRKGISSGSRIPKPTVTYSAREGMEPSFHDFEAHLLMWKVSNDSRWPSIDAIPLSRFLAGHSAIISFSPREMMSSDLQGLHKYHVFISDPETLDGLECTKLTILKTNFQETASLGKVILWLAEARNYLPLKIEFFSRDNENRPPDLMSRTTDFREVAPGVWYPSRCESVTYRNRFVRPQAGSNVLSNPDEREVGHRREMTLQEVSLSPAFDRSHFELFVPPQSPRPSRYDTYEEALEKLNRSRALLKEELAQPPTNPDEIRHLADGRRAAGSIRRSESFEQLWDLIPKRYLTHIIVGTIITIWILILCYRYAIRRKKSETPNPSDHSPSRPAPK
ncbi:MAG: hypothetical protein KDA36_10860, partial [Planctomycetaceae bacterium]|nr:hypothetical protein [Planctomycetaceae bacterium]